MKPEQHLECFFMGGKTTFLTTEAIKKISPIYYKDIPEAEDFTNKFKPINEIKYYDVPKLPIEFIEPIPQDEDSTEKLIILKVKKNLDLMLNFFPFKKENIKEGEEQAIFNEYLKDIFKSSGVNPPSFNKALMEPNNIIRNGIFFSFLKHVSDDKYVVDFTHFAKYNFRKEINNPILKGNLILKNDILKFENIVRFDKDLKQIELIEADDSEKFIKTRAELYANVFFELTLMQHLVGCHFLAATNLNVGVRLLSKENPLKQFLWNFSYGTLHINSQGNVLIGKNIGSLISLSPFTEESFYDYLRDSIEKSDIKIFETESALDSKLTDDLKSIKNIFRKNIENIVQYSNEKFKEENQKMFSFLKSKITFFKEKTDVEILTNLIYAVSAYHEIVGNNSIELKSQDFYMYYNINKYDYINAMLVLVVTAIPIRKITAHDVELTIKNQSAKKIYLNMIKELLEYELSMEIGDKNHLRIKPSNLESAVQV